MKLHKLTTDRILHHLMNENETSKATYEAMLRLASKLADNIPTYPDLEKIEADVKALSDVVSVLARSVPVRG